MKLVDAINQISQIVPIDEEKKQEIISNYDNKSDKEIIKDLSLIAYRILGDNEELLDQVLEIIRNINPSICPSLEEMKVIISKMYSNDVEGNMTLEENHNLVNETLNKCTQLLNKYGVDYYIVGALPCFIKTGTPLFRYHDDIDIMINEDDIDKVKEVMGLIGYDFHDDRFPTLDRARTMQEERPPHTVLAQNPNNEFHVGFFTFRREMDRSITMREYSYRIENEEVLVDLLERKSDPTGTSLRYDDNPTTYMGTSFRTSTVESVYHLKEYTRRPKDITDIKKLSPYVDQAKLEELKKHPNSDIHTRNISVQSNNIVK